MDGEARGFPKRVMAVLAVAALASGCAMPLRGYGALGTALSAASADGGFTMAPVAGGIDTLAAASVRDALVARGLKPEPGTRRRVEVGFSVRGPRIEVMAPSADGKAAAESGGRNWPALCKRQSFALSIAFIDTTTGEVRARGGAAATRCKGTPAELMPLLARAALAGS